eukprot:4171476-Pyramimonas_sp.AAC.1
MDPTLHCLVRQRAMLREAGPSGQIRSAIRRGARVAAMICSSACACPQHLGKQSSYVVANVIAEVSFL